MKAMILAAGLGTRLRPLTDDRPKALVTVGGRTMLEIALSRLRSVGVREVIVNAHHFAEKIVDYLKANGNFGMSIEISREEELLDTGGGLQKAAYFFSGSSEPFLVHNVDVLSNIDLDSMVRFHVREGALATLAVQQRSTSRPLLFDEHLQLHGRSTGPVAEPHMQALAFSGIHVLSPQIFGQMNEQGAFSIIDAYLRLAAEGEKILAFRADGCYWRDLGRPENVAQAAQDLEIGRLEQNQSIRALGERK
jgi:NDP-sugar pyrophosphorylase family protein